MAATSVTRRSLVGRIGVCDSGLPGSMSGAAQGREQEGEAKGAGENGEALRVFKAAGEGAIDWVEYFRQLREGGFSGPAESHLEFDYRGANLLQSTWWQESYPFIVSRNQVIELMASELTTFNHFALAAGWDAAQLI